MRSFKRIGNRSMPETKCERGSSNGNKYCVWYQNRSLGMWFVNCIRSQAQGISLAIGSTWESGFDPMELWVMGPPCGSKSRKGDVILHDFDSKACLTITYQLCRQQHRYQGRGTKGTIFLLVWTRRTYRQISRPSVVTGKSSIIVTGSYWQSGTTMCLPKQEIITAQLSRIQERLNKQWKGKCVFTPISGVYPSQGQAEHDIHDRIESRKSFR